MSASDERLSLSVLGDISSIDRALSRLDRSLGSIEDAYLSVASAAGLAEGRVDEAGDAARTSSGQFLALAGAIEVADAALSDFGDLDIDTISSSGLVRGFQALPDDIDTSIAALERLESTADRAGGETHYSIVVDRSDLEDAFDELPAQRVRVNPVLQSLQGELDSVAPAAEDVEREVSESISTSRERSVAVETDNVEAAAVALGDLNRASEDVQTTFAELDGNDIRIGVDAENIDSTLAGLQSVGVAAESIDGEESVISVNLDRSDYDPDTLATLPDQSAVAEIDTEADTSDITTTRGLLDALADRETVAEIDTNADLSSLAAARSSLDAIPNRVSTHLSADADTSVIDSYQTHLDDIADRYVARLDIDRDTGALNAYQTRLDRFADRDIEVPIDTETDLNGVLAAAAGVESLPDDPSVLIETESDLAGVVALSSALATLPDEHTTRVATDMDVAGTASHIAALEGIEHQADEAGGELIETRRAAMGLGAVSLGSLGFASLPSLPDRLSTPSVSSPGPLDIGARFTGGDAVDEAASQLASVSGDRQVDISLGDSESDVLQALSNLRAGLESLPEDERVNIFTEADLDDLVATIGGVEALPDEVDFDVDAHTAEAQAGLSAVLAQAQAMDGLSVDIEADVDADSSALSVLREGGDGFDFDFPDPPEMDADRRGGVLSEGAGGFSALMGGLARGAPGVGGAAQAIGGMSPAAIAGAGAGVGGLASMGVGAVSALGGGAVGAGGLLGSLALGVKLNTSDREIQSTKQRIQDELGVLRGNVDFEIISDTLLSDASEVVGMVADEVASISGELRSTFTDIRAGFWAEFPSILDSASNAVTTLDDNISSITIGTLETIGPTIDELTRAADQVLPILTGWARPLGPILGTMSRIGTSLFDFADAPVQGILDPLAALAPIGDLIADGFSVAGDAISYVYENIGSENVAAFAGAVEWAAGGVRFLAEGLYDIGSALGIWNALAAGVRLVGDGISWAAGLAGNLFGAFVDGAQVALDALVNLYNTANDVPGIGGPDIQAPDLSNLGGGGGTGGGPSSPATASQPPTTAVEATIADSAVASLPSNTAAASTSGTSTASTASTASGSGTGAGGASSTAGTRSSTVNRFENNVTVELAANAVNEAQARRIARKVHNNMMRLQRKQNGPSA